MKTFEEIFDLIIEEREKGRIWKGELDFNFDEDGQDDCVFKYADKEIEEFIKRENIMNIIFEKFKFQIMARKKALSVKIPIEEHSIILKRILLQNKIMFNLQKQLPSYSISVSINIHEYQYPYNDTYVLEVTVWR